MMQHRLYIWKYIKKLNPVSMVGNSHFIKTYRLYTTNTLSTVHVLWWYTWIYIFHQVIDLLVKILQFPLDGVPDEQNIILVFKEAYEILYTYMIGKSRKNALYFAKYIEFFQTQFTQKVAFNIILRNIEIYSEKDFKQ